MRGFEAHGDSIVAVLDEQERAVIARIVADVGLLLGGEPFGMTHAPPEHRDHVDALAHALARLGESVSEPTDPAILKVLPNASSDREEAEEFRRLTESDIRETKTRRLRAIWEDLSEEGPEWIMTHERAREAVAALTDVRLVMASRLGVETEDDARRLHEERELALTVADGAAEFSASPERVWLAMLYDALMWLQETLVACLMTAREDAAS